MTPKIAGYKTTIHVKLGDEWICECGEVHKLESAYLAAHWDDKLVHQCDTCHIVRDVHAGRITTPTKRAVK